MVTEPTAAEAELAALLRLPEALERAEEAALVAERVPVEPETLAQ